MNEMYFTMEILCRMQKDEYFCQNFRIEHTIHHQWLMKKRERERGYKGRGERELGTKRNQDVKEEARRGEKPKKPKNPRNSNK